jgi:hypothetical protein
MRYKLLAAFLFVALLAMPSMGWAVAANVKNDSNRLTGTVDPHDWTVSGGMNTTGDTVVGTVSWAPTTVNLLSVTVCGNTATLYSNPTTDGTAARTAAFVYPNVTSGTCHIIADYDANATSSIIIMHEASGVDTTTPVTGTPACNGQLLVATTTDLITSGATTPAFDGSYVSGFTANNTGAGQIPGVNESWTQGVNTSTRESEYLVQGTAAAITAKFTASVANDNFVTCVVALKDASAGGGGASAPRQLMMIGVGGG